MLVLRMLVLTAKTGFTATIGPDTACCLYNRFECCMNWLSKTTL